MTILMIRLFAIANVVLDDVAFCFGDHAAVLRLCLLFLVVVIVADEERKIAGNAKLCERTRTCFFRP